MARRPLAGLRRGHHVLGAGRDGPRPLRAARERRRDDDPGEGRRDASPTHVPDEDERRWVEPALLALLGVEAPAPAGRRSCSPPGGRSSSGSRPTAPVVHGLRGPPLGRRRACSTSSTTCSSGPKARPIYIVTLARPELLDDAARTGAPASATSSASRLEPLAEAAMRELLAGLVPGLPTHGRRARSSRAPTASRCTPSRRSGCSWRTDGSGARTARYRAGRRPRRARRAGDPPGAHRGPPRRPRPDRPVAAPGRRGPGPELHRGRPRARSRASCRTTLEPRLRRLVRRELLVARGGPASPERGQYAFVQALIREVAYNTLAQRDRKARHLAAARYFESARRATSSPAALAGHYVAAFRNAPEGPEASALAAQARVALRAAADGRRPSVHNARRPRSSNRPSK